MRGRYRIEVREAEILGFPTTGHELAFIRDGNENVIWLTDEELVNLGAAVNKRLANRKTTDA